MEIKKLKLKELVHSCEELKEYINKEKPDWIIPIYSGGLELCKIIWGENEFPKNLIKSVSIRHKENKIMDKIIKFLPEYITDFLRQIDSIRPKSNKRDIELPDFLPLFLSLTISPLSVIPDTCKFLCLLFQSENTEDQATSGSGSLEFFT